MLDAGPALGSGSVLGEVVEERERVSFAAAELGGEIEDGTGLGPLAGEAADDLAGEGGEIPGQVRAREEPVRFLVVWRSASVADVVEVDGEFGGIKGFALTQVLARSNDFIPRFQRHINTSCGPKGSIVHISCT